MRLLNLRIGQRIKLLSRKGYSDKKCPPAASAAAPEEANKPQLTESEPCEAGPCYRQPRVVIVGAGLAGLSAAHRLVQCGIDNYTVLEATDRPGGRIHSCWLGDAVAELGTQGADENKRTSTLLYTMATHDELARPRSDSTRGLFSRAGGGDPDLPVTITAYHRFRQIQKEAALLFCFGSSKQHGSLLHFIGMRIQQELRDYPVDQQYDAARIMFGMSSVLRSKCGDDMSLVSADSLGSYVELPGGEVRVPLGTVGALAPLLRLVPDCAVRYRKPVSVIHWGTAQKSGYRAIVRCSDGEEFPADYVIVTVSMGVLRCFADKMFCPTLPASKIEAINYLGWEMCNKIYLDYSRPFWFWSTCDLNFRFCAGQLAERCDWTRSVTHVTPVQESEHVLQVRVTGADAACTESLSDREVADGITCLLRDCTGNPELPYPATMMRSRWSTDHYFCGAFSCPGEGGACGLSERYQSELGAPLPGTSESVPPVLMFAGEATVPGYAGTVDGARLSGVREAERVVQLTNRFRGPPLPPTDAEVLPSERQKALAHVKRICNY